MGLPWVAIIHLGKRAVAPDKSANVATSCRQPSAGVVGTALGLSFQEAGGHISFLAQYAEQASFEKGGIDRYLCLRCKHRSLLRWL